MEKNNKYNKPEARLLIFTPFAFQSRQKLRARNKVKIGWFLNYHFLCSSVSWPCNRCLIFFFFSLPAWLSAKGLKKKKKISSGGKKKVKSKGPNKNKNDAYFCFSSLHPLLPPPYGGHHRACESRAAYFFGFLIIIITIKMEQKKYNKQ
jgi:hypothetical protein